MARSAGAAPDASEAPADDAAAAAARRAEAQVRTHYRFVWRVLRRLGLDPASADDAAQKVFIVAASRSIPVESQRAFLYRTAVRVAAREHRTLRRRRETTDAQLDGLVDPAPTPDELVQQLRARQLLDQLLGELKFEQRVVFVLHEIEELPVLEIASTLGVPIGTVASRLRRARTAFAAAATRRSRTAALPERQRGGT
jgi:RNA polymerase sigma-70 factor, ECF subfamily